MSRPTAGTFPEYFTNYINQLGIDDIHEAVAKYGKSVVDFFRQLPAEKVDFRYAEGKWSLKEMLLHIIDAERVFAYRALCIARRDKTPLPAFDENVYAEFSNADSRDWNNLLDEFEATRRSTDYLINSFEAEQLKQEGITSNQHNNVNAICFVIYGHILHHINIVKERYL